MQSYFIAWWNLENLFDVYDSKTRPEWLQKELESELKGWDLAVRDRKIEQLASIIRKMNNNGPDVLGVCEVENKTVLDLLVQKLKSSGRRYAVAHHDTSDNRGIDVAFIYDKNKFTFEDQFFYVVLKRTATRDIFQVNLHTSSNRPLIFIGNHWPSRQGEPMQSEPYRIIAAETLSYWHERIVEKRGKDVGVVVVGDFNDEPYSRSIVEYALATNSETKVIHSQTPKLFNLMWPFLGKGLGTHYFSNFPNILDQCMVSKGILTGKSGFQIRKDSSSMPSVRIEMFDEMVSKGEYPVPLRFGRPSAQMNENGYSDHYPISFVLEEME